MGGMNTRKLTKSMDVVKLGKKKKLSESMCRVDQRLLKMSSGHGALRFYINHLQQQWDTANMDIGRLMVTFSRLLR